MNIKVTKLTIEYTDKQGNEFRKTLNNEDAQKWYQNNVEFAKFAEKHNKNYKWHDLDWKLEKLNSKIDDPNEDILAYIK